MLTEADVKRVLDEFICSYNIEHTDDITLFHVDHVHITDIYVSEKTLLPPRKFRRALPTDIVKHFGLHWFDDPVILSLHNGTVKSTWYNATTYQDVVSLSKNVGYLLFRRGMEEERNTYIMEYLQNILLSSITSAQKDEVNAHRKIMKLNWAKEDEHLNYYSVPSSIKWSHTKIMKCNLKKADYWSILPNIQEHLKHWRAQLEILKNAHSLEDLLI